ncbi:MAG: NADH-quinone oxidoreductase subunit NuoG [Rickettsiaceae bacterium]|nr:NADH-quinone oxidoreductase subunit NuoG [Rickettsiaceae bacterium]MDP4832538.1 NADH-quinone oxidoreductase subunit NuoG [Rickettsiaceae bacterium]MDP5020220.1 NADH-quinone oxidoreductase subunit NuoG [Rickettsiaceae bacterium]MDP5082884.1 NADH-quinone oxidoreductase subunit NuoG [Rickettsiaceae bacterium]
MPKLTIDDNEIEVEEGLTVMQACEHAGIEVPHFCFHERLKIAGNCRMCLVEMERAPKPIASCAMPVSEGMVIKTNTPKIKKAREGVMEFLLANHPLDCPICDQGGECDLQDQAFKYGKGGSRYSDNKRSVKDKNLGPLVKTQMTRCIHCTRCIRFATEVAGVQEIGAINRGEHMEITSYLEKTLTSELSGNIIDLCPVGALTSKPYAFNARSWELEKTESIDVMDALGSNIRIDSRGLEVMRILPKLNENINEEWLSDKARFACDGLKVQRLDVPYIRKNGKLLAASWEQSIEYIVEQINAVKGDEIAAVAGSTTGVESMFLLKKMLSNLGSDKVDANQFGYKLDTTSRSNYLFNTGIANAANADVCLLVGANLRKAAPVLNARIGQRVRSGDMHIARVGEISDQTYAIEDLGNDVSILEEILSGKGEFARRLKAANYPMLIIGDAALSRSDGHAILALAHEIAKKYNIVSANWNGFNILHNHASMVGGLDVGFIYGKSGNGTEEILKQAKDKKVKVLYLLGADDFDMSLIDQDCFVIYQGHHGDKAADRADVILPEAAYTEQDAIFVNMEGRPQYARAAISPLGSAKESWDIITHLADKLDLGMPFKNLADVRNMLAKENAVFANIGTVIPTNFIAFKSSTKLLKKPLEDVLTNYYMTDPISRSSVTMAKCVQAQKSEEAAL